MQRFEWKIESDLGASNGHICRLAMWICMALLFIGLFVPSSQAGVSDGKPSSLLSQIAVNGQSTTLLPDGRWLLLGAKGEKKDEVAIFDPVKGSLTVLQHKMITGRHYHTATMLPDGSVFIFGGYDVNDSALASAERFDPATGKLSVINEPGLMPRARHTATLMTDGRVLIVGGLSGRDGVEPRSEVWNPRTGGSDSFSASLEVPRHGHLARLLATAPVLIAGGKDSAGKDVIKDEVFDPVKERFLELSVLGQDALPPVAWESQPPQLVESRPQTGASDVAVDDRAVLRFSKALSPSTLSASSVALFGATGAIPVRVTPAENGLLLFVTPISDLQPGGDYTLVVIGAKDDAGQLLPDITIGFKTRVLSTADTSGQGASAQQGVVAAVPKANAKTPKGQGASSAAYAGPDIWAPDANALRGDWRSRRNPSPLQQLPSLSAPEGVTALAGQVLLLDGKAAEGVTLRIDERVAVADETGRFLMTELSPGHHTLQIDGHTADQPGHVYGFFEARITVNAEGQTTSLPFTIWMPRIDEQRTVSISSPTQSEVVVTTPHIPGLELHIPSGSVIRDRAGKVVTRVSMTPIPVDRPPFPLPGVPVPVYFTIQPGSAHVQSIDPGSMRGAWLVYPNYTSEAPGTRIAFWNYDPVTKGWYVYGHGQVTTDGRQIKPDPGVSLYEFTGAMVSQPSNAPAEGPTPGGCKAADPVDCYTGLFTHTRTDLSLADVIPLNLTRTYRPRDTRSRTFGIGTNHDFDMFMVGDTSPWSYQDLILSDGGRIHFGRISAGTGYADAVYEHTATPTRFHGAKLAWYNVGSCVWKMTLKDGTVYCFPNSDGLTSARAAAPVSMTDRYGNTVTFTRDSSSNLTRATSPNGRYIDFTYDASNRVTQAKDIGGRTVTYEYDASGRLWKVTNPIGGVEEYAYDSSHRMLTVKKPSGDIMMTNVYDANGRVSQQTLAGGGVYQFAYTLNGSGAVTQTDVTDPRGNVRRMTFNASGYPLTQTFALGKSEQQTVTYERNATTNLLTAEIDTLGRRTEYTYDAMGNTLTVTRLAGTANAVTETFTYEPAFNQVATHTNALSHTTSFTYDAMGSLVSLVDPLNHTTAFDYTTAGQLSSMTDPLNNSANFEYQNGDLVSTTDALGRAITRYTDVVGRVLSVTDPLGNRTLYEFDAMDRLTKTIDALGGTTSLSYDANSNLLTLTDARGGVTTWAYDSKDRLTSRTDPLLVVESYLYDDNDNVTRLTDRRGKIATFTYDALNRRTKSEFGRGVQGQNLTAPDATVDVTWDAGDRLTQLVDTQGGTITRVYDGLDRLTQETTAQGQVDYGYDTASRRTSLTVAGQAAISYTYDNANRLTQITRGAQTVQYSHDDANRRATLTLPNGIVATYSYDNANQLTGISYANGSTSVGDLTYSYDAAGRRTQIGGSLARFNAPTLVSSATYNAANRLTSWGGTSHTYDNAGNLTNDGSRTYTWDSRQRLSVLSGSVTASFSYDADNRRKQKTVTGTATSFVYDGLQAVQEIKNSQTTNLLPGAGLDELISRTDPSGTVRYFLGDALGSTAALTDSAGTAQTQYAYTPYGVATASGATSDNAFQYTGRENDGTGLYYYRARYYDPAKGRFTAEDPIGFEGGLNVYAYVGGDPLLNTDPKGECPWCIAAGAGALTGAAFDLGLQMMQNGFNPECIDWGRVGGSALAGAALSGLGPTGFLLGRGGTRAAPYGFSKSAGLLNSGKNRFGWGYRAVDNSNVLRSVINGKKFDVPGTAVSPLANPLRDGAVSGAIGGSANSAAGGSCGCNE